MARRSGLGKGLSALIPTEATGESDSAPSGGAHLAHQAQRLPAPQPLRRGVHVVVGRVDQGGRTAPAGPGAARWRRRGRDLRADRRGAAMAGRPAGRPADDPGARPGRRRRRQPRAGAGREPPPGQDLNALEEAAAYQQLIDEFGLHPRAGGHPGGQEPGRRSPTPSGCSSCRRGPSGPWPSGTISAGHARALLGTPDRALQETLVKRIVDRGADGPGRRGAGARRRRSSCRRAAAGARAAEPRPTEPVRPQVRPNPACRRPRAASCPSRVSSSSRSCSRPTSTPG